MIGKLMDMQILLYCMIFSGMLGALGMFIVNRSYKRKIKLSGHLAELKEKWMDLWKSRDVLLHRMNRWVCYPSLGCIFFLGTALLLNWRSGPGDGLGLRYLYAGVMVPVCLLLLRQALDFSYREELLIDSVADYIEEAKGVMAEKQVDEIPFRAREEMVEHIAQSIKESAATDGRFGQMLTPEEEEIMRDVIKEFMT